MRRIGGFVAWIGSAVFVVSGRRRHTILTCDWSSDVCSSDLEATVIRPLREPELVAEIGFAEWTNDGRLRQPRFLGLRDEIGRASCRERVYAPLHGGCRRQRAGSRAGEAGRRTRPHRAAGCPP